MLSSSIDDEPGVCLFYFLSVSLLVWFMKLPRNSGRAAKTAKFASFRSRDSSCSDFVIGPRPPPLPDPRISQGWYCDLTWKAKLWYIPSFFVLSWHLFDPVNCSVFSQLWLITVYFLLGWWWLLDRCDDIGSWLDATGFRSSSDEILLRHDGSVVKKHSPYIDMEQMHLWVCIVLLRAGICLVRWLWLVMRYSVWLRCAYWFRQALQPNFDHDDALCHGVLFLYSSWVTTTETHRACFSIILRLLVLTYAKRLLRATGIATLCSKLRHWYWILSTPDAGFHKMLEETLSMLDDVDSDIGSHWTYLPSWNKIFHPFDKVPADCDVDVRGDTVADLFSFPVVDCQVSTSYDVGWRIRRLCRHVAQKVEQNHSSISSTPPRVHHQTSSSPVQQLSLDQMTRRFIARFNPAVNGLRLLWVERKEHQLKVIKTPRKVSVHMRRCYQDLLSYSRGIFMFPAMTEIVLNSIGRPSDFPLIMDTGASCCVSPCKEDFVEYRESSVKITDLSSSNKVKGEGLVRWTVKDALGQPHVITIRAYHVPHASVRLLSPQCLLQLDKTQKGRITQDLSAFRVKLGDGTVLNAPYGMGNLPVLPMFVQGDDVWTSTFSFTATDRKTWVRHVLDEQNQNLSLAQKEILLWHQRLSHAGLTTIHDLCRQKRSPHVKSEEDVIPLRDGPCLPCTYRPPSDVCTNMICGACAVAKAKRRTPGISPAKSSPVFGSLRPHDIRPGDCVSCDHYSSPVTRRSVATSGYSSSRHGFTGGTIFVDNASGWMMHKPQKSLSSSDTIRSKLILEREAADVNVRIKSIHSDNGVFNSSDFRAHCERLNQKLSFSGVGAKHQNGIAENAIRTVSSMARANMIHATLRWPERSLLDLWPFAMTYAIWVHNRLPIQGRGLCPLEIWSQTKLHHSELSRAHVWGCPVYVLDPALQDGKKIPKWDCKARQGIFVGFSDEHSSLVPLVLNPSTQHVSPQYHVVFDDKFSTIPTLYSEQSRNLQWSKLFELGANEQYVEDEDIVDGQDALGQEWNLPDESPDSVDCRVDDADDEANDDISTTANDDPPLPPPPPAMTVPEGDPTADDPEGAEVAVPPVQTRAQRTTRGDWKDGPAKNSVLREHQGKWKTGLICLLSVPAFALSSLHSWSQPPAAVTNVGASEGPIWSKMKIKRGQLVGMPVLQEDWSDLGQQTAYGNNGCFSAYLQPDLFDEASALTVTDVQPHILQAKMRKTDADNPSYNQAMASPEADQWWQAIITEFETLELDLKAWRLVQKQPGMSILPSTWAFKLKRYPDGTAMKYKARFCVRGDKQIEGIDFWETWSPVVQWSTVRTMMTLSTKLGLHTVQADITAAFVHANLEPGEEIFVQQPRGLSRGDDLVLQLKKSVYGLKQAPRYFFKHLSEKLMLCGMKQSDKDPCLFIGKTIIAVVYVDDVLFYSKNEEDITELIRQLKEDHDVMIRKEGDAAGYLGVSVEKLSDNRLNLTQSGLTERIVKALGLCSSNSTAIGTPAETAPLPKDVDGSPACASFNYAAVIGMLLYLSGHTRPDIAFAVHQCARYTFNPTKRHEQALVRIGRYLKGTMKRGLILSPTDSPHIDCYPDADFAGLYGHEDSQDPHCARSRTGYIITAFGCPILWKSKMQTEIALSTMEAEYVALSTACKDLFPIVAMVKELASAVGIQVEDVAKMHIKIHEDNVGALTLAKLEPGRMTPRSKHYAIKYHWFREHVYANRVSIVKIASANQLGDLFTKGLARPAFEHLRRLLMGW